LAEIKSNWRADNNGSLPQIADNRRKRGYHNRRDEKYAYLEANRSRYRQAKCPETLKIFDEFCVVSSYPRKYAIRLLNTLLRQSRRRPGNPPQ
jgi:hypothetical protein